MAAIIKLISNAGEIEFSNSTGYMPPLISQKPEAIRTNEQGSSYQRINVELSGFFEGSEHSVVQQKMALLLDIIQNNELTLYYHDGARVVINNQRVWVASYSDPLQWKEYNANYSISLYYFRPSTHNSLIAVTYTPDNAGTYTFDPPPTITDVSKANRKSIRDNKQTFSGQDLGHMVQLTLEGILIADTPEALNTKRAALKAAFAYDGVLNVGDFYTQAVRTIDQNIPNVYPQTFLTYTLTVGFDTSDIIDCNLQMDIGRVHNNPLIKEWPFCPQAPVVIERSTSPQVINYSLEAKGYNLTTIRSFLAAEAYLIVIPGGTELPGGSESRVLQGGDPSISVRFSKFYPTPVISNLSNT